ncbi:amino acid/amide ABC transporter membrane protein 1, HAAT family /amino acid/amide ABC transporter membrane protein 2, HAAT family [Cribrihabitans marinus]|uniref:Amino acid/amide ABC transporter membrane protein 1, HAAT family /amino acid/amide ABC transporter membrane protein 2, HAAT family n=1 Tax=Cribrihabitans marinus TaxID=1227549 RepID=A0A1H6SIL5_9RHOB|nr:ABC transporter permease [Cribrihabitans marinus]GGH23305.1 branched-chain amino acid ABC transporter permease [Cribrihabitans marinus]SEI67789.1 amino acid/amide ABC transporter membrane protein 1, HAAT family /amino acid/amide ABC transporter membrane protein 2, HAAT family [Cribrihabitans marinus]
MGFYLAQLLTGLANASSLFLIASGLSIIFGVTRIVNFAHGSFYMVGAYLAYSLVTWLDGGILGFWFSIVLAALLVGVIGLVVELIILRRIYHAPELFQLVATFGVVLIVQDATLAIWGAEDLLGPRAPGLDSAVRILGEPIPEYDLALIAIGPAVLLAIWLVFHRTRWGVLVRAATQDREMVGALGVNQAWLFSATFILGSFLAGLGGALQIPREAVSLQMDLSIIGEAFVVTVIGGMGSVSGAFIAAVLISVLNAFAILIFPQISIVLPFVVMAVVLIVRPYGIFGRPGSEHGGTEDPDQPLRLLSGKGAMMLAAAVMALALSPVFVADFTMILLVDVMVATLFAVSLHFMMGVGGMVSFGHAAYFGVGAYAAAMAVKLLGLGMIPAMLLAPFGAALAALFFGWFCVRLSGVYLAMLTLAAAQILWGVTFQWQDVTGGDDGILGVWPAAWASSDRVYFYIAFALCIGGIWALRRAAHSPFGYVLRGVRDSRIRAEAIGVDTRFHQWMGFTVAGAFAGLAGVVFAFSKGSVFPDALGIAQSIDGLIMVLLGGIHALAGPILGAAAFVLIEDWVTRLDYWRVIFGGIILVIVLLAPDGIAGGVNRLMRLLRRDAA